MGLTGIQHRTLRELAYEELRKGFYAGRFIPGEAVTIAKLSRELEVGAMPCREAVQQLASQGAFQLLANRSVQVPSYTADELTQLYETRTLNECYAAARAAELASEDDCRQLTVKLNALEAALATRDPDQTQLCNAEFHFGIYRLCDNRFVFDMIERLWLRVGPLHRAIWRDTDQAALGIEGVMGLHRDLVDMIRTDRASSAKRIIKKMLALSRVWVLDHMELLSQSERDQNLA